MKIPFHSEEIRREHGGFNMIVAKIQVSGVRANVVYRKIIPTGIVGAQVELDYAEDIWHGLHKTVVFRGAVTKDVVADANLVTIPPEVVETTGITLQMGVYGVDDDGNLAIPTLWTSLGHVRAATNPSGDTSTDPSLPVWAQIRAMIGNLDALDTTAKNNLVAAVNEAMTKGGGEVDAAEIQRIVEDYLAANPPTVTETDPTVPDWAKQPTKPTYTAAEVGALPDTYTPPNQTAQQVGADPAGTAASAVSQHNTDAAAHNDLRLALQGLSDRINAAMDSDDTTLDQMSEVVAYIKSNKSLIDAITTSKVSVSDIVNDLVTNVADKPLSAAQGVAIKGLIEELRTLIPEAYTLPTATETTLGGVKPVTATDAMTQPVGVDADGRLMTNPVSGGSGISVTGATVGQTVKISAVDENGVPTAWEPADFPSGADEPTGVIELLVDHTITAEEASALSITFTKEKWPLIDGQKFVFVRVVKPTGISGWWKLKAGNKAIIHFSGSTNISQVGFAMVTNGIWIADSSEGGNMASGPNLRPAIWVGYKAYSAIDPSSYDYYDSFTLYSFVSVWPEGTTIEIYGVK